MTGTKPNSVRLSIEIEHIDIIHDDLDWRFSRFNHSFSAFNGKFTAEPHAAHVKLQVEFITGKLSREIDFHLITKTLQFLRF